MLKRGGYNEHYNNYRSCASGGIIEIGAARIRGGKIVDEYSQLVNPQMPLPNGISALTGITNKMLADNPPIDDIISGFMNFIGNDVLIGHNLASFDLRVLADTCFTHYGLMLENNYSDTLILAKCNDTLNSVLPLYGGLGMKEIHARKGLKKSQKILDHMGSTELAANLFRATQTDEKLRRENIQGKSNANKVHYEVGAKVRETIKELGGTMPEDLPTPEKDIKQVKKELAKLPKK